MTIKNTSLYSPSPTTEKVPHTPAWLSEMTAGSVIRYVVIVICSLFITENMASGMELKFVTQDFPPFSHGLNPGEKNPNAEVVGPAADIIRSVCMEMKTSCSLRLLPWRRAQAEVKLGRSHAMFLIGWNEERTSWLYFSHPVVVTEYGFFVRKDNPLEYKKSADIKGYTVGVYGPSNTSKSLEDIKTQMTDFTIDMRPGDESGFRKLSVNRIHAVYSNRDVGYVMIRKLGLDNIRYAGRHKGLTYYIGFSKKYTPKPVFDKFNDTLYELYKKGVIESILKKYGMDPATIEIE